MKIGLCLTFYACFYSSLTMKNTQGTTTKSISSFSGQPPGSPTLCKPMCTLEEVEMETSLEERRSFISGLIQHKTFITTLQYGTLLRSCEYGGTTNCCTFFPIQLNVLHVTCVCKVNIKANCLVSFSRGMCENTVCFLFLKGKCYLGFWFFYSFFSKESSKFIESLHQSKFPKILNLLSTFTLLI